MLPSGSTFHLDWSISLHWMPVSLTKMVRLDQDLRHAEADKLYSTMPA